MEREGLEAEMKREEVKRGGEGGTRFIYATAHGSLIQKGTKEPEFQYGNKVV